MPNWIQAGHLDEFPPGSAQELVIAGRIVALFRIGEEIYALDGICPHQGGPLGKGRLQGCIITCPWHGWQFDVRTGQHQVNQSLRHASFPVRTAAGIVYVDLGE